MVALFHREGRSGKVNREVRAATEEREIKGKIVEQCASLVRVPDLKMATETDRKQAFHSPSRRYKKAIQDPSFP